MQTPASVPDALVSRKSIRAFLPDAVDVNTIRDILRYACRSASASNTQPWRVHVCTGQILRTLSDALLLAHDAQDGTHQEEARYYPEQWRAPYLERRRQVGKDLYGLLGIAKGDTAGMHAQYARNYRFFDAPVGLFFTVERHLTSGHAVWVDLGAFLQSVMVMARHFGLDTCAQQAFARYHRIIRQHLPMGDQELLVCGMSMGYRDPEHPANRLETQREPVDAFTSFSGF